MEKEISSKLKALLEDKMGEIRNRVAEGQYASALERNELETSVFLYETINQIEALTNAAVASSLVGTVKLMTLWFEVTLVAMLSAPQDGNSAKKIAEITEETQALIVMQARSILIAANVPEEKHSEIIKIVYSAIATNERRFKNAVAEDVEISQSKKQAGSKRA